MKHKFVEVVIAVSKSFTAVHSTKAKHVNLSEVKAYKPTDTTVNSSTKSPPHPNPHPTTPHHTQPVLRPTPTPRPPPHPTPLILPPRPTPPVLPPLPSTPTHTYTPTPPPPTHPQPTPPHPSSTHPLPLHPPTPIWDGFLETSVATRIAFQWRAVFILNNINSVSRSHLHQSSREITKSSSQRKWKKEKNIRALKAAQWTLDQIITSSCWF